MRVPDQNDHRAKKFVFHLKVELSLDPNDHAENLKSAIESGLQSTHQYEKTAKGIGNYDTPNGKKIFFSLDLNPEEFVYEDQEDIFRVDLVKKGFKFVEKYMDMLVKESSGITMAKVKEKATYHLDYRRINKVVYSRNSPALGNVSYTSSTNGDIKPGGTRP